MPLRDRPFTTRQAMACEVPTRILRQWVSERDVRRPFRGVYVDSSLPDTVLVRAQALQLVLSPSTLVCGRTAAWLDGVDTFDYRELDVLPPIETCVLPEFTRCRRRECVGKSRDLALSDIENVAGVLKTTAVRTALDLGCELSRRDALAALDSYLRLGKVTKQELKGQLPRYKGRRGVVQLRQLVAIADGRAESPGESWTRLTIVDAGLPVPELQWWVYVHGRPVYRLDLAYPKHRVLVEFDGEEFHDSPEARLADERRRAWLRDHGWTIVVLTKRDFSTDRVGEWTQNLRELLFLG